jgi:hypothetical protein
MRLAFPTDGRGEAPKAAGGGTEVVREGYGTESPATPECLIKEVCQRDNLVRALKRVKPKFYSYILIIKLYQAVILAELSFGTTFPRGRTGDGILTPTAWQSLPATPWRAVRRRYHW